MAALMTATPLRQPRAEPTVIAAAPRMATSGNDSRRRQGPTPDPEVGEWM
jgi:hypothetical protein